MAFAPPTPPASPRRPPLDGRARRRRATGLLIATLLVVATGGCASNRPPRPRLAYPPDEFRRALQARVPELDGALARAPFELDAEIVERAERVVLDAPRGPDRVRALVGFLSNPAPDGLGLRYDWSVTAGAERTIELGRGNCFALASVLVGLGRGLGWPIFYAEAHPRRPETQEFEAVTAVSDHMVVIIVAKTVRMVVDFTGLVETGYDITPIDDLTAYAHLVNNVSGQRVMALERPAEERDWETALEGFELATRIDPELGRAWNNLGIAYARLGRFEEARRAYERALELGTAFGSAERNLSLMETRASGAPSLIESRLPD